MCMYGRDKTKKDPYMIRILMKMFSRGELHKDYGECMDCSCFVCLCGGDM